MCQTRRRGGENPIERMTFGVETISPDLVYVDAYDLLATKKGGFIAALRSGDGVHFTDEGAWRIADAVWAAMKRDWRPAQ